MRQESVIAHANPKAARNPVEYDGSENRLPAQEKECGHSSRVEKGDEYYVAPVSAGFLTACV